VYDLDGVLGTDPGSIRVVGSGTLIPSAEKLMIAAKEGGGEELPLSAPFEGLAKGDSQ